MSFHLKFMWLQKQSVEETNTVLFLLWLHFMVKTEMHASKNKWIDDASSPIELRICFLDYTWSDQIWTVGIEWGR